MILVKIARFSTQRVEKTPLASCQSGVAIKYLVQLKLYVTPDLETKAFARVYANLELSVNETFAVYRTMVKILAILKSPSCQDTIFNTKNRTCYCYMFWQ